MGDNNTRNFLSRISRGVRQPVMPLTGVHPRHITRIYLTVFAGFLLLAGVSTAVASRGTATDLRQQSGSVPDITQTSTQPITREEQPAMNSDTSTSTSQQGTSTNNSDTNVSIRSDQSGTAVQINGEDMSVGPNGSMNRSYQSEDGSARVDVSIQNSSNGDSSDGETSSQGRSRFNVRTESSSSSSSSIRSNTTVRSTE